MIDLKPANAFASDTLPLTGEGYKIDPLPATRITAIAPFPGAADALRERLGGFPGPGEVLDQGERRLVWAGRDLAFVFGEGLPEGLEKCCAMTDQSDGWCGVELQGAGAAALLSRRLPFDLRNMATPTAARSVMDHLPVLVIRWQSDRFEIWVWRSMYDSFVQQITK